MHRWRLFGAIAALALGLAGCSGVCRVFVWRHGVSHYLKKTAGDRAIDCGTVVHPAFERTLSPTDEERMSACATFAHTSRAAFYLSQEGPGIDSYIATGLVGREDGSVLRFRYDSSPCGGACCNEAFTIAKCALPPPGARLGPLFECPAESEPRLAEPGHTLER